MSDSFRQQPFARYFGCELRPVEAGLVHISLSFMPQVAQQNGQMHGGAVTCIVDAAVGFAAITLVEAGIVVLTTELKVNFLRPVGIGLLVV